MSAQPAPSSTAAAASTPAAPPQQQQQLTNVHPQPTASLEADPTAGADGTEDADAYDSAYADSDGASSRYTSITSSIVDYEYSNGRRYHGYRKGAYLLPNDEAEQDRLDLLHHIFLLLLDGKLYAAPISRDRAPTRILDLCTGTGLWAIDCADEFPSAEVLGNDLSPVQPGWVPPNLKFFIDDVEEEWPYRADEPFDFIHGRGLGGAVADWDRLFRRCYEHLRPGGWVEVQEPEAWFTSDDETKDRVEATNKWQTLCNEAADTFGKRINLAATHKQRLIDAGFVDVRDDVYKCPLGPWPKDPKYKQIGRYQLEHACAGIEPYTLGFIGKVLGWTELECRVLIANVLRELRDRRNHLYVNFHFVYGRKPEGTAV